MQSLSGPRLFGLIVLAAALGLAAYTFMTASQEQPVAQQNEDIPIGGPFEMVDHTGKTVSDETYRGKFMLIYFGFTYCPDICPTELQVVSSALNGLSENELNALQPLFVTVDPERDTVDEMAGYVGHFHERLVGLTGSLEQVSSMAEAYRVWFKKTADDDSTAGYTMEHTNIVYLMGPDGKYLDHFTYATKSDQMAERIKQHLADS